NPQIHSHAPKDFERQFVTLLACFENHRRRTVLFTLQHRFRIAWTRLACHAHDRRRRPKNLPTPTTTTRARNAAKRIDTHVPDLCRRTIHSAPQLAIENDAAPNAGSKRHTNNRFATHACALPRFTDRGSVGVIFEDGW